MKKYLGLAAILIFKILSAQNWTTEEQYVQKFAPYAVEEMEKFKIPASITLAQGLLETGGGQSRLALQGNNHFGIKCKEDWTGKTMSHTDDAPNECFRVYDDPRQSYEDHSKFLATRKFYVNLFKLAPDDYRGWAQGLKNAGYATNPRYAHILLDKIEKHKLYEFDKTNSKEVLFTVLKLYPELRNDKVFMAMAEQTKVVTKPATVSVPYVPTSYAKQQEMVTKLKRDKELLNSILVKNHPNGGKKFIIVPADTDLTFIAKKFNVRENKLQKWNELNSSKLKKYSILFLESKSSEGNVENYRAMVGESMHDIAQKFAIRLSKLYSRNRMTDGSQPAVNQLIYLQGKRPM